MGAPAGCPAPLEMLMIEPVPSCSRIWRNTRMANQRGLIRFIWMAKEWKRTVRSKSSAPRGAPWIFWTSSGMSSTCGAGTVPPALFTRMSMRP